MSHTKLTRHSSVSSLQNLLLDDEDDNNLNNSSSSSNSSMIDDHRHHHHHHHHVDDGDVDDEDDLKDLADSCCSDGDMFDPPAWRPGRFLQFADIDLSVEDEPSVRPVSLPTERMGIHAARCGGGGAAGLGDSDDDGFAGFGSGVGRRAGSSFSESFAVQMDSDHMACIRHWRPSVTRRTLVLVASCMTVALTALTLLSFALY